jgi:DNA (cytosine-5)-methyltransferase 1
MKPPRATLADERRQRAATAPVTHYVSGLFAGIGGIELGLQAAGHHAVLLCEKEPAALAVLRDRFPNVRIAEDVTKLDHIPAETTLLTAGFPCQDLSQAGRTAGIHGRNSGLVSHVFRLLQDRIEAGKPVPWVLLENVSFMLRLAKGAALDVVLTELERLGYHWAYRVLDSRAFGLPQRRERVYIVACVPDAGDPRSVLLSGDAGGPPPPPEHRGRACGFYWTEGRGGLGWAVDAIPTLKGGSMIGIASPPAIWMPDGRIVTPDLRDAERLQGFPADWRAAATGSKGRRGEGARWKLVGNAVSVDAAAWIGHQLGRPGQYVESHDVLLKHHSPWPRAAWCLDPGDRYMSPLSAWPVSVPATPLADFLKFEPRPLSLRATTGFHSRTQEATLRFPRGFIEAIEAHVEYMSAERAGV